MNLNSILFGGISFAAGMACLAIAVYLAPHWKTRNAGKLILLKVSIAIWAMGYAMEFFSPGLPLILWWVRVEYFGAAWVGFFLFDFILSISRHRRKLSRPLYLGMACVPITVILLALTNDSHHLMWRSAVLDFSGPIPVVDFTRGPFFWLFVVFSYGLLFLATLLLVHSLVSARGLLKKQHLTILTGILFPWAANLVYVLGPTGRTLPDLTPIAFTISGTAFAWGLIRYQMLSLIPLAHQTMIESMGDPVICLDEKNRILDINQAGQTAFSMAKDLPGHRDLESECPALYQSLVTHRRPEPVEIQVSLDSDKGPRNWDMRIFPLRPSKVRSSGWLIILRDITDRVRMEEMMVQSEKMLSVGGLAAGMAHEINNPLAGILQSLQVIRNRLLTPTAPNVRAAEKSGIDLSNLKTYLTERQILSMMDLMADSGLRAAGIIKNMLSFSQKSGRDKSAHDLCAILDETISLVENDYRMKQHYDFKSIGIQKEYSGKIPPIFCQKGEIQQVLLNILKNGAEAMTEAKIPSPTFHIRCGVKQDTTVIQIRDNGPGMDASTRKRIFEPFFTTKDVGAGTGLGLSVSYFIITENHGGSLEVHSEPGQGTTFTIALPIKAHT